MKSIYNYNTRKMEKEFSSLITTLKNIPYEKQKEVLDKEYEMRKADVDRMLKQIQDNSETCRIKLLSTSDRVIPSVGGISP